MKPSIFSEIAHLSTEQQNKNSHTIDTASSLEIVRIMNKEDEKCAKAVSEQLEPIAKAIDLTTEKLKSGGRLFYIGAGTSGRLGVLDASECPPTFGTDPEMVQGIIAGGYETLIRSKEGIEDQEFQGWEDLKNKHVSEKDVICGIMASGRTPYVVGALKKAKEANISTLLIACNSKEQLKVDADISICVTAGPEVITGSTRLKSGTMQKMVLNMISTGVMIRLGKVYKNIMVDVRMTSKKLEERAKKMVMSLCDLSYTDAENLLNKAHGHVKSAIAMHYTHQSYADVQQSFKQSDGYLRPIIESVKP